MRQLLNMLLYIPARKILLLARRVLDVGPPLLREVCKQTDQLRAFHVEDVMPSLLEFLLAAARDKQDAQLQQRYDGLKAKVKESKAFSEDGVEGILNGLEEALRNTTKSPAPAPFSLADLLAFGTLDE